MCIVQVALSMEVAEIPTPKRQPVFKGIEISREAIALRSLPGLIRVERM